jgi:hypothetical protein
VTLPSVALSINQPWAWLIASGLKDIENRNWTTGFRGEFLIHAGLKLDHDCMGSLVGGHHPVTNDTWGGQQGNPYPQGGIIGIAEVVDVITLRSGGAENPWFVGRYGFVIRNARPMDLIPCVGALGFFVPDFTRTYTPKPERKPRAPKTPAGEPRASLDLFTGFTETIA